MRGLGRHVELMMPPEPANDERPPLWPGLSRRTEEQIWLAISWAVIVAIYGSAILWLDARHWIGVGITIGGASVFIVGAALYRLIVYGRA